MNALPEFYVGPSFKRSVSATIAIGIVGVTVGCGEAISDRLDARARDFSDAEGPRPDGAAESIDPLVGSWTFSGRVPAVVFITLTFDADKTFGLDEQIAPGTWPAGYDGGPAGCVVSIRIAGTYDATASDEMRTLTWTPTSGVSNAVTGCRDSGNDREGAPIDGDSIDGYVAQGVLPPRSVQYTVSRASLTLNPGVAGGDLSSETRFSRKPD